MIKVQDQTREEQLVDFCEKSIDEMNTLINMFHDDRRVSANLHDLRCHIAFMRTSIQIIKEPSLAKK